MRGYIVLNGTWEGRRFGETDNDFIDKVARKPTRKGQALEREAYTQVEFLYPNKTGEVERWIFWVLADTHITRTDKLVKEYFQKHEDLI